MNGRDEGVIDSIAYGAVTGGISKLSTQFTALIGYPDIHPAWQVWKERYYRAILEDIQSRLTAPTGLPVPEPIGRVMQPEMMVQGVRYIIMHQSSGQRDLRRSVLTFSHIATGGSRSGALFVFLYNVRAVRHLFRSEIKQVTLAPTDMSFAWNERMP
jgi:hypothetical protein